MTRYNISIKFFKIMIQFKQFSWKWYLVPVKHGGKIQLASVTSKWFWIWDCRAIA